MAVASRWHTRANALTALRGMAAPLLVVAIWQGRAVPALVIYVLAVATDFADGWVARRYGEASPLGGLVDHGVDALFVTFGTAALASVGALPVVLPPLIAAAFVQYALDSRAGASRALRGSALGRWNGIAYYVVIAVPVVRDALALGWPGPGAVQACGWALVASTGVSMALRLRRARAAA